MKALETAITDEQILDAMLAIARAMEPYAGNFGKEPLDDFVTNLEQAVEIEREDRAMNADAAAHDARRSE